MWLLKEVTCLISLWDVKEKAFLISMNLIKIHDLNIINTQYFRLRFSLANAINTF